MEDDRNEDVSERARKWGTVAHLSAFAGLVIPLGNVLGPFVILLLTKGDDEGGFGESNAREALNFQITVTLAVLSLAVLVFVSTLVGIAFVALPGIAVTGSLMTVTGAIVLLSLVFVVKAAIEASERRSYSYPFSYEFV
ncbi:DUF4870 domain-containing protein [Haladaptatus sp. F3-133]|jgi:uncharacterized Tic20 family protein|uniref:DUF4870 domain-containing protein n=1 Tax=Halorutilus salinus TaxID=2487751 RepID=A0A9Q4C620_9EURY|nr:DUF4870 domain-containing protein [Halorutilus salinus]MCX2819941.1 DUF4870 domain-containing protein [Halorutilus salinus]